MRFSIKAYNPEGTPKLIYYFWFDPEDPLTRHRFKNQDGFIVEMKVDDEVVYEYNSRGSTPKANQDE